MKQSGGREGGSKEGKIEGWKRRREEGKKGGRKRRMEKGRTFHSDYH